MRFGAGIGAQGSGSRRAVHQAIRCVAALALALAFGRAPGAGPEESLSSSWRPDPGAVIATMAGEPITEEQVFLWQLISRRDPMVVKDWKLAATLNDRTRLEPLEEAARSLIETRLLARVPLEDSPINPRLLTKGARLYAAPVARFVYADRIVRPTLKLNPMDIAFYYRTHQEDYKGEEVITVRRLRVPLDQPVTPATRAAAMETARALRDEAVESGGLLDVLVAYPQYQIDEPVDASREIRRGTADVDPLIERPVFNLARGEISEPLDTPTAVFVFESLGQRDARVRPVSEVRGMIEDELRGRFLTQQLDYHLGQVRKKYRPVNRASIFLFMEDDAELLRAGNFALTKGEFKRLFPEIEVPAEGPPRIVEGLCEEILRNEIVTQELEQTGFDADGRYQEGLRLGADLVRGAEVLRRFRALQNPDDATVREYAAANASRIAPQMAKSVWRAEATARGRGDLTPGQLNYLTIRMENFLSEKIPAAEQQLRERLQIAGESALRDPTAVTDRMFRPSEDHFRVKVTPAGNFDAQRARLELGQAWEDLQVGRFTPPAALADGTVVSYFTSGEVALAAPPEDELLRLARTRLIVEGGRDAALDQLGGSGAEGQIVWNFQVSSP